MSSKTKVPKGSEVDDDHDVHARFVGSTSSSGPSIEKAQNNKSSTLIKDALPKEGKLRE